MKYADVDMQEVQSHSSSLVHSSSENGTPDLGAKRCKTPDAVSVSNGCSSKGRSPEVIDLDGEDSPIENEEATSTVIGLTYAKNVSTSRQQGANKDAVDKKASESHVESASAECPTMKKGSSGVKEMSAPAEADEALSNHSAEGERKRSSLTTNDESDPKRPKLDSGAKSRLPGENDSVRESEGKELPKARKDTVEVSVVDLVEDDDELEKVKKDAGHDKNPSGGELKNVDAQAPSASKTASTNASEPPAPEVGVPSSVSSVQEVESVKKLSSASAEEKRTSLAAAYLSGKNGLILPAPSLEAKKAKLSSKLEKLATPSPSNVTLAVVAPKQSTTATIAQVPVLITASTPEATEVPVLASSKAMESAKEVAKEGETVLSGADLEKKKGLNTVHSETRKAVQQLTRPELESFFLELACELIICKSDAGRYRQLYEEMKESCENKANKIAQLNKQLVDLTAVVHRAINDGKERRDALPLKVTRSVGLQLEQSQILAAYKNRNREDRCFVTPPGTSNPASSATSSTDRGQLKYGRAYTPAKTTPPFTPNGSPASKDGPLGLPGPGRSPQRQLKALHPRPSATVSQAGPQPSSSTPQPSPATAQSAQDAASKRLGFIDIADDKISNSGSSIGVRRHQLSSVIVSSAPSNSVNSSPGMNTISSSQAMPPALKVVPSQYSRTTSLPAGTFQTSGANTRVVTGAAIPVASGTPVANSRLTYIIPTSSPIAMQPRQLLLQTAAQSQQIRGRSPVTTMPAMIMRPNTTVLQVPPGSISSTTPSLIRAVQPGAGQQMITATKTPPQPPPTRILGLPNRPSPTLPKHPAPLPAQPQPTVVNANLKPIPRRPVLKLSKVMNGIVLSWNMTATTPHEDIASYQLYAYQEGANAPPSPSLWKKVGDVKALPLPMACTLTQFADGHTYHFAVRAVDVHGRVGEFSVPGTIELFS
ncbi:activating transcription factor 7-interacting protein 1-like isoform X2 [Ischnura elegans]|uniref:activating transcription factor 7-interacting protein 1-like isoform X2 n=1 Tax=Ischnura elegans TaxID=197161 RepID=UPI001ED88B30|nr:activating transcription factor 7-interacting protein 1-like isoform X2 [Ischnura elegans]